MSCVFEFFVSQVLVGLGKRLIYNFDFSVLGLCCWFFIIIILMEQSVLYTQQTETQHNPVRKMQ